MKNIQKIIALLVLAFGTYAQAQVTVNYTYDNLNRLTKAEYSSGKGIQYSYDELGNRTQEVKMSNLAVENIDSKSKIQLFPNPFLDEMTIISNGKSIKELTLFDVSGKQINRYENLNTKEYKLNAKNIPSGIYIVSIRTEENTENYKIIKK